MFQSDNLAKLQLKFGDKLFCDSTFKSCPRVGYQLFITRVIDESKNAYYTTSFSIMKNKTKSDYILIFKKLKEHINDFLEIGENYTITEIHIDFETAIGDACRFFLIPKFDIAFGIWKGLSIIKKIVFVKK